MTQQVHFFRSSILPVFLFLISSLQNPAVADSDNFSDVFGISTGLGYAVTENHTGATAWANLYMFVFNFSLDHSDYTDYSTTNYSTGLGLGKLLQFQYGDGNKGKVYRVRVEFNLYENFSLMLARERYKDNHGLDNVSVGIGLTFDDK